jgi:lysophospholipase L1-like esterase
MVLYVDLDLGRFVSGAGLGTAPRTIEHKRGDGGEVRIQFVRGDALEELAPDSSIIYEAKLRGKYDADPLIQAVDFTLADGEYSAALAYDGDALELAFLVDADEENDVAELEVMYEVTWQEPGKGWLSTDTQNGLIHNDVIRSGGELLPAISGEVAAVAAEVKILFDDETLVTNQSGSITIGDWVLNLFMTGGTGTQGADPCLVNDGTGGADGWSEWIQSIAEVINDGAGTAPNYSISGTISAHDEVSATVVDDGGSMIYLVLTAKVGGTAGNAITYDFDDSEDTEDLAGNLAGGVDTRSFTGGDFVQTQSQSLEETEKELARENIGLNDALGLSVAATEYQRLQLRAKLRLKTADDRLVETYGARHSLTNDAVGRMAGFLNGLREIGARDSLEDAAFYGERFQPIGAFLTTVYSILGNADLSVTGSPDPLRAGLGFTNDDPTSPTTAQRADGAIFSNAGEWTILNQSARKIYGSSTGQRRAWNAYDASPLALAIQMQNASNWQSYSYGDSAAVSMSGLKGVVDAGYNPILMQNASVAASDSFGQRLLGSGAFATTTGRGPVLFDGLSVGAGTSNGSSFAQYFDGVVSYWAVWNELLDDDQADDLAALVDETIAPKIRMVFEGDSIAANSTGYGYHFQSNEGFFGGNVDFVQQATSGHTSIQARDEIGTAAGISDALSDSSIPVFCLVQAGSNDRGDTADAAETVANLRLLWQAARDRGMKVIACTVPGSKFFDTGQAAEFWTGTSGPLSHDVRAEINLMIRADLARYDYILDVDQLGINEWGANYWNNTSAYFDGVHPGTSETCAGPLAMDALYEMIKGDMP